ncbi:hypothetical protein KGF56_003064 [Candida oxycetoniae]|uniref:Uncharacterized protein n=1 Tax=Candida oxycetoniae TaxID=497107 RepID=A0AAI9SWI2_9ASCO|nr:uncharacterized protein KGF56_003064 [Candida oxycetoniae]KAI3404164.2 hypothetical protein KGF56_003064 [Candida oxycetoniae]
MSNEELSIQETNKLREKLGLKPIPVSAKKEVTIKNDHVDVDVDVDVVTNNNICGANLKKDILLRERIQEAKRAANKRRPTNSNDVVDVVDDGDDGDDGDDAAIDVYAGDNVEGTDNWLNSLGSKKQLLSKEPKLDNREKLGNANKVNAIIGHSSKRLQGLRNNDILTLQDSGLLDDETGDVLVNEKLSNDTKLEIDLENRKEAEMAKFSGRHYRKYNEEEESERNEEPVAMIKKGKVVLTNNSSSTQNDESSVSNANRTRFTNFFDDIEEQATQITPPQVKMKKIKKKKPLDESTKRKRTEIEDGELQQQDQFLDLDYENLEEEFYSCINMNRQVKQKQKRKMMSPEEIALDIANSVQEEKEDEEKKQMYAGNLYDDTEGFLNKIEVNILGNQSDGDRGMRDLGGYHSSNVKHHDGSEPPHELHASIDGDIQVASSHDGDIQAASSHDGDIQASSSHDGDENEPGPTFSGGLADTLKFLQSKNIIQSSNPCENDDGELAKKSSLLALKIGIEKRILEEDLRKDKSYMKLSKSERLDFLDKELDKRLQNKGIVAEASHKGKKDENSRWRKRRKRSITGAGDKEDETGKFRSYQPKVELSYKDDEGRVLNAKQAYKHLSHKYHGTGLGKRQNIGGAKLSLERKIID